MSKLFLLSLTISLYASTYESGKIDMHGGDESYGFSKKKHGFSKNFACMSDFLDKNTSKSKSSKEK